MLAAGINIRTEFMYMIDVPAQRGPAIQFLMIARIALASTALATTGFVVRAADCQEACLAACPKHPGTFGTPQLDRSCVQRCLELRCSEGEPSTPAPPVDRSEIQTVEIWIRSFIPIRHEGNPGYTRPVPNKPIHTMIPDPSPIATGCYLTDQRMFSDDPRALARVGTHVAIKIGAQPTITVAENPLSESVEVSCETGAERCRKPVDSSRSSTGPVTRQGNTVRLHVHGKANNACFRLSPDIHYEGYFIIDVAGRTIKFEGKIGRFPAFEAYGRANNGPIRKIFQELPMQGSTVWQVPLTRSVNTHAIKF
jgi:hypothetical protein